MAASPKADPHAVLAVYRLKPNATKEAMAGLLRDHARVLLEEKLRTPREPWVLESAGDPPHILEIFEWIDATAAERAHKNASVQALWGRFGAIFDDVGIMPADLKEAKERFPHLRSLKI